MANKVSTQKRKNTIKISAKTIADNAVQATDNLVEGSLATGAQWQKIMAKALTEGTTLFGKQQDLTLTTLEEIKGHVISANKRFQKLFGFELPKFKKAVKAKKATKVEKVVKTTVAKKAKKTVKAVKKTVAPKKTINKDNLRTIEGIGPKIETLLNQAGITTFAQIAKTNIKDLKAILDAAGPRYKMHNPKTWKTQATNLAKK